ncbi:MAG: preprotein translocase subunit SecA [Verrucomicrobia bacterium]|nr:preprotein translocase subunit SecA [Cytophagales bacterium]
MFNSMLKGVAKIFGGTKSEKDVKSVQPLVAQVNEVYASLTAISDEALRGKTAELKAILAEKLAVVDNKITAFKNLLEENPDMDILEKEKIFNQIDEAEKERNKQLEVALLDILPTAFAVVRETARRFAQNEKLEVQATDFDRQLAQTKKNVEISGEKAIWHNRWLAAGNEIIWNMVHYDVQLIGGIVLHQGKISEMATGEGKTLVATLPAYLNALAGRGVHIVTVNDYLSKRDSEWNAPLFEFHGLVVDCVDKHQPNSEERRRAYLADITYGTNNEFGFDYLRDNMAREVAELVQRKHHYAMVDEVDSVLIDEARTPLIIAGPVERSNEQEFYDLKPRVVRLVEAQKKVTNDFLVEAKRKITGNDEKEGGLALFRAFRGLPKSKALIKFLSESGMRAVMQKTENYYLQDNSRMMPEADVPLYFTIDEKNNQVELTERGIEYITGNSEDAQFFVMPDIGTELSVIENNRELTAEEKLLQKENLIQDYNIKSSRIHTVNQLLKAFTLFENGTEYILEEGKVKIVDEQTGRVMDGRRYSDGLHQAIEAKENVKVEEATQTYATITLQNYFRMYHKLAGMTGTAETEAGELWDIYKLDVVSIPTNIPPQRKDQEDKVYKTAREKYNAVIQEITELTQQGRPVLVGTTSVEISELLSRLLTVRKIRHQVLNAKLHQKEAEIVAEAGKPSTVTIATNMAGRGTDIKLAPESKAAGGLAIVGTERHESRRVDRQLRGRAGRQGDAGTSQFFVSLEDNLMRLFGSERLSKVMDRLGLEEGEVIQHSMITSSIERAQKKVEENNFGMRKRLLEYDNVMNYQRTVIYKRRMNALFGERLALDILNITYDTCEAIINSTQGEYETFKLEVISDLGFDTAVTEAEFMSKNQQLVIDKLFKEAEAHYEAKNQQVAQQGLKVFSDIPKQFEFVVIPFTDGIKRIEVVADLKKVLETKGKELITQAEKMISLAIIDQEWKEHLREMDDLKQSVQNAAFEQKDPLLVYKFEASDLFSAFLKRINKDAISFLMKAHIPVQQQAIKESRQVREPKKPKYQLSKAEAQSVLSNGGTDVLEDEMPERTPEKIMPIKSNKIANRNDLVNVQYIDGTIKKAVKYKKIEDDLRNNKCVIVD